jgi:hypothetical protein
MNLQHDNPTATPLVRWEFARGRRHVMCAIRGSAAGPYEVAIVPIWDVGRTAIETYATATEALRRHAAIAAQLRDAGWTIASYTAEPQGQAA